MVLIILVTLLILGIAFYQTVQGCFSAMITTVLTVLAAAVAFNYYESLGGMLSGKIGAVAAPAAMATIFVIVLLAMRFAFDYFIRGNVVLGMWPDRIGGATFGFVTAMIMTGMFMIIFQMLPMPASILTYQPYDSGLGVKDGGPPRWAANFTLATAGRLSDGSLQAITSPRGFRVSHDDLLLESFCLRNRPTGARASTSTTAMKVMTAHVAEVPAKDSHRQISEADKKVIGKIKGDTPPYPLLSWGEKDDTKVLMIRVSISESARNKDDGWWRLPATHFRLVCESGESFYPVGYLTHSAEWRVHTSISDKQITQIGDILVARQGKSRSAKRLVVDWLYRVPTNEKASYVVFRRAAVASLPPVIEGLPGAQDALPIKSGRSPSRARPSGGRSRRPPPE